MIFQWMSQLSKNILSDIIQMQYQNLKDIFIQILSNLKNIIYESLVELISREFQTKIFDCSIREIWNIWDLVKRNFDFHGKWTNTCYAREILEYLRLKCQINWNGLSWTKHILQIEKHVSKNKFIKIVTNVSKSLNIMKIMKLVNFFQKRIQILFQTWKKHFRINWDHWKSGIQVSY
jgi:hypothetical protein